MVRRSAYELVEDEHYGKVRLKRWNGLRDKHAPDLTCDLIRAETHLWRGINRQKPSGFCLAAARPPAGIVITAQIIWSACVNRWQIQPGTRFRKETLGWTLPRFQSAETGDTWNTRSASQIAWKIARLPKPLEIRLVRYCSHPDTSVREK